ncbi:MAG: CRISPR-associated endonuclease Cas2 [Patescibacteria group bacterium]
MRQKNKQSVQLRPTTQKVLVLLLGGLALGLSGSPSNYFRILKNIQKDWLSINNKALHNAIKSLYRSKLIDAKENEDGTITMFLTEAGKTRAISYNIESIFIKPMKKWDYMWRLVLFDIPESKKKARNALSQVLKNIGMLQLQKSVFISPYECKDEINFVIEFFQLKQHVRYAIIQHIDNELDLKNIFHLL